MSDSPPVGRTKHGELTLDQIAGLMPGLGRIMRDISDRYTLTYYAAKGGNWDLARYALGGLRKLSRTGELTRPKMAEALRAFETEFLSPIASAIAARDWSAFDEAFTRATGEANRLHRELGYGYIEWVLPPQPPAHLTLGPVAIPDAEDGSAR